MDVGMVQETDPFLLMVSDPDRSRSARVPKPSDALIDGCRRGDRAALDEVFRAHAASLERILVRLIGPDADAEDLLQETFAAAIGAFPRFRGEASVGTWLHQIAIHVAHRHLRAPRRRREVPQTDGGDDAPATEESPEHVTARRELTDRLYAHLDELDARKRIALVLHVVDDLPIAEVAALMGATRAATKSRLFWARRWLARRLRKDPAFDAGGPR
jgi:RNA polymerase sigma-70 factor (ECF subfamily)